MNKRNWVVAKLNLKNIKISYFIIALVFVTQLVQTSIYALIAVNSGRAGIQLQISCGNALWFLMLIAPIFIPLQNFRRMINLGAKRNDFFWGSIITYAVLAGVISLANSFVYYIFDRSLMNTGYFIGIERMLENPSLFSEYNVIVNVIELFGWSGHGIFIATLQQFVFLFMLATLVHSLTAIQDKWYGWVVDIIIGAVLAVFIPIASLRLLLMWFLNLFTFHSNFILQITVCLILTVIIYILNKPIWERKII